MGITSDKIVKRDARVCVCGQPPGMGEAPRRRCGARVHEC